VRDHFQEGTSLEHDRLVKLLEEQMAHVEKRFGDRGLYEVSQKVHDSFERAPQITQEILKPNYWIRFAVLLMGLLMVATIAMAFSQLQFRLADGWSVLEGIEAGISTLVYSGVAIIFLVSLEIRQRRQQTLKALQEVRALAHVLDMHQMNKDPEQLVFAAELSDESPENIMTPFLLERYLDYTADLLSLLGKLAAWYAQQVNDPEVLIAINEIEQLTGDMARKIWQKISIINSVQTSET
jgi:hypothetical protein